MARGFAEGSLELRFIQMTAVLGAVALLGGCATITRGTSDQIQIHSDPNEARASTSMGQSCTTPCTITVNRKDEFTVRVEKEGYLSQNVDVKTQIAPGGAAGFAGNVLIGGLIGMGTDAVTGATLDHSPNPVNVVLKSNGVPRSRGKTSRQPANPDSSNEVIREMLRPNS